MNLEEVQKQINDLPYRSIWFTKKEVLELPNILDDTEKIHGLCSGLLDGNTWMMVCTNKRLLFLDKGMVFGLKVKEFLLNKINAVSYSKGLLMGKISVSHGSGSFQIEQIEKHVVQQFTDSLTLCIKNAQNPNPQIATAPEAEDEELLRIKKIREYKALCDEGIITPEQFEAKKNELLGL